MEIRIFYTGLLLSFILILKSTISHPARPEDISGESLEQQQQQLVDDDELSFLQNRLNSSRTNAILGPRRGLQLINPCLEPKKSGQCEAYIPRYYFNSETGDCESFVYGGCGGNGNNFNNLQSCEQRCSAHLRRNQEVSTQLPVQVEQIGLENVCELPPAEGRGCHAYLPRWTYDVKQGKCIQFIYKGCGATGNNFINRNRCDQKCGNYKKKQEELQLLQHRSLELNNSSGGNEETTTPRIPQDIPPESCLQPMNPGSCYALNTRYYYNKENKRCQSFVYGGCGGNDNNFHTSHECMRTCGGNGFGENIACNKISCPWNLYTHYLSKGCIPVYDGQACCPTRFECSIQNEILPVKERLDLNTTSVSGKPKCSYKGRQYEVGSPVPEASSNSACRAACICLEEDEKARITCASIECPEFLGALPPGKESCIRLYRKQSCCAHDFYCPNDTATIDAVKGGDDGESQFQLPLAPDSDSIKCLYNGKEYVEGERIYPENDKCQTCLCQRGFNGTFTDEFCEPVDCGIEIYYSDQLEKGCVPVYYQDSKGNQNCCPIGWECPDDVPVSQIQNIERSPALTGTTESPRFLRVDRVVSSDVCTLSREIGPCKASRKRFFYNSATQKCEEFTYGGCRGNRNNFVAIKDCQRICENNGENMGESERTQSEIDDSRKSPLVRSGFLPPTIRTPPIPNQESNPKIFELSEVDPCTQELKRGVCKGYFPRYYFSPEENKCLPFIYGGCRGNRNNFYSIETCEALCQNKIPTESLRLSNITIISSSSSSNSNPNNGEERSSESQNQTPTLPDISHLQVIDITNISRRSGGLPNEPALVVDITEEDPCNLPPETGRCKGFYRRYYYDPSVQYCKRFTYGGCGGNGNNFVRLKECDTRCAPNQGKGLPGSGSPGGISPKWRNAVVNQPTQRQQEGHQKPQLPIGLHVERCNLPMSVGSCFGSIPSFYYDVLTGTCQNFTYGGCFGNANRFGSLLECERICKDSSNSEGTGYRKPKIIRHHQTPSRNINDEDADNDESKEEQTIPATGFRRTLTLAGAQAEDSEEDTDYIPGGRRRRPNNEADKSICLLSPQPGNCRGHNLRYFWHNEIKQCLPFVYSGCRGNSNNFLSESDCQSRCDTGPTIEEITQKGILSCTFGNETIPVGGRLGGSPLLKGGSEDESSSCGVPICQCITPPALTCIQRECPEQPHITGGSISRERSESLPCPIPDCAPHCSSGISPETGCPTCECNNENNNPNGFIIELAIVDDSEETKNADVVKG